MFKFKTAYGFFNTPEWDDDLIIRSLKTYGEWAYTEQQLIAPMIQADDILWDVGAFLGTFGLGVSKLAKNPPAKILAFEPNRSLYKCLVANLEENAPCLFDVVPFGVAKNNCMLRPLDESGHTNAGGISYEETFISDQKNIEAKSLAELRSIYGDYDVLKLDIEGMEDEAIRGDIDYIMKRRPLIWAECNESLSAIQLLEALVYLNYEPLYVAFPSFRSNNFNGSSVKFYPMAYEAVLLAAPPERLTQFNISLSDEDIIVRPVKTSFDLRRALWSTPRWAMEEWTNLERPELIALLGRNLKQEELVSFMNDRI